MFLPYIQSFRSSRAGSPPDHPLANVASPNRLVTNPTPTASTRSRESAASIRTRPPPCRTPLLRADIDNTQRPPSRIPPRSARSSFTHHAATTMVPRHPAVEGPGAPGVGQDHPGATAPEPPRPHASLIARRSRCCTDRRQRGQYLECSRAGPLQTTHSGDGEEVRSPRRWPGGQGPLPAQYPDPMAFRSNGRPARWAP